MLLIGNFEKVMVILKILFAILVLYLDCYFQEVKATITKLAESENDCNILRFLVFKFSVE